jgi:hypothetical protein
VSAAQAACEAFWAAVRRQKGGEDAGDWPGSAWEWAETQNVRTAWEEAVTAALAVRQPQVITQTGSTAQPTAGTPGVVQFADARRTQPAPERQHDFSCHADDRIHAEDCECWCHDAHSAPGDSTECEACGMHRPPTQAGQPAPELAAAMAESRACREALAEIADLTPAASRSAIRIARRALEGK